MTARETLREMVEREMREASFGIEHRDWSGKVDGLLLVGTAVDVALRLISKWGHAPNCVCRPEHKPPATGPYSHPSNYRSAIVDPRCAQPGGEEGK